MGQIHCEQTSIHPLSLIQWVTAYTELGRLHKKGNKRKFLACDKLYDRAVKSWDKLNHTKKFVYCITGLNE